MNFNWPLAPLELERAWGRAGSPGFILGFFEQKHHNDPSLFSPKARNLFDGP